MKSNFRKFLAIILLVAQFGIMATVMFEAKPAQAVFGIGDIVFNTEIANWYDVFKDIGIAAAERILQSYINQYLTKFVNQVVQKYKINNYLYYDQILSDYYLLSYFQDKIADPDLRGIFNLLYASKVTGAPTGTTGQGDPRDALIPKLKQKIDDYYVKQGGVPSTSISSPSTTLSNLDFYSAAQVWSLNPPAATTQNLQAQFGSFQSSATTASELEVIVGNSLKAGRVIGGTCKVPWNNDDGSAADGSAYGTPSACADIGGTWAPSGVDNLRSFIADPTSFIMSNVDGAMKQLFASNFDPTYIWSAVGSFIGNFIYGKLSLADNGNTSGGSVFFDGGKPYVGSGQYLTKGTEVDIDGDGIPDGIDIDSKYSTDHILNGNAPYNDVCYHGQGADGTCKLSTQVGNSPYFQSLCRDLDNTLTALQILHDFIVNHKAETSSGDLTSATLRDNSLWQTWITKSELASTAVEGLNFDIEGLHDINYDDFQININKFDTYLSEVIQRMIQDQTVDAAGFGFTNFQMFADAVQNVYDYIQTFKTTIKHCDQPDGSGVPGIPDPTLPGEGGGGADCSEDPNAKACTIPDNIELVRQVKSYVENFTNISGMSVTCEGYEIVSRVAWVLGGGAGNVVTFHSSRCETNQISGDLVGYPDGSFVDVLSLGSTPTPVWLPSPGVPWNQAESGVSFTNATNPGDPSDACYLTLSCP